MVVSIDGIIDWSIKSHQNQVEVMYEFRNGVASTHPISNKFVCKVNRRNLTLQMTLVTITTRESDRQAGKREIANLQKVTGQVSFFMSCRRTKIYLRTDSVVVEDAI